MADLETFARRIREIAGRIETNVDQGVIKTGIVTAQAVVLDTPVKTGRARGGWQLSNGAPIEKELERLDQIGSTTIAANNANAQTRVSGQDIFITNNVEYVVYLNDGTPKLPALQFVQAAVIVGSRFAATLKVVT